MTDKMTVGDIVIQLQDEVTWPSFVIRTLTISDVCKMSYLLVWLFQTYKSTSILPTFIPCSKCIVFRDLRRELWPSTTLLSGRTTEFPRTARLSSSSDGKLSGTDGPRCPWSCTAGAWHEDAIWQCALWYQMLLSSNLRNLPFKHIVYWYISVLE